MLAPDVLAALPFLIKGIELVIVHPGSRCVVKYIPITINRNILLQYRILEPRHIAICTAKSSIFCVFRKT